MAIVVAVTVRAFILQTFFIPSESMEHTLNINDRVLVNKLVYDFRDPHRGEIVVFKAPAEWRSNPSEIDFIKRVIGVGGDHVVCCDDQGRLTINGVALDETYLYRNGFGEADAASQDDFDVVVPNGRLWVMGDHRSHSGDSREQYSKHGDVARATITVGFRHRPRLRPFLAARPGRLAHGSGYVRPDSVILALGGNLWRSLCPAALACVQWRGG